MDIYLPIAEVSVNWPTLVILGAVVGFVSGLFGIGGGFLMAPILVFLGIPPTVAVASQASHVVASSTSGVIRYAGQGAVDFKMGSVMATGGAVGALAGVELFRYLRLLGQAPVHGCHGDVQRAEALLQLRHHVQPGLHTLNLLVQLGLQLLQVCRRRLPLFHQRHLGQHRVLACFQLSLPQSQGVGADRQRRLDGGRGGRGRV